MRLSKRSSYVKFTDEMEHAMSAQRHLPLLRAPIIVTYGTNETPEFQRQSRDFAAAVKAAGKPVELVERRTQSLRDGGDAGQPLRPEWPRRAGDDEAFACLRCGCAPSSFALDRGCRGGFQTAPTCCTRRRMQLVTVRKLLRVGWHTSCCIPNLHRT